MAITISQSKNAIEIKPAMGITKFILDSIKPAKYCWADLRKSINIPGNIFSWKIQFRNRETRSSFFALMCFSLLFSFYLYILSKHLLHHLYTLLALSTIPVFPPTIYYLMWGIPLKLSQLKKKKKREPIIYSFIVLQSIKSCMCSLTWGWARRTAVCFGKRSRTRRDACAITLPAITHAGKLLARRVAQFWPVPSVSFFPDKVWAQFRGWCRPGTTANKQQGMQLLFRGMEKVKPHGFVPCQATPAGLQAKENSYLFTTVYLASTHKCLDCRSSMEGNQIVVLMAGIHCPVIPDFQY